MMKLLVQSSNNSLACSTWENYQSVLGMLEEFSRVMGKRMSFLMSESKVLVFIAFLLHRGLKASSVEKTLSAVRMLHKTKGYAVPVLRPPIV